MKRVRAANEQAKDPAIPGDRDEWFFLDTALLTHVLAYAWKSYYRLALVCRRFLAVTTSRPFWRALAFHALIPLGVPRIVLERIDIFHGMKASDPSHYLLWDLFSKNSLIKIRFPEDYNTAIIFTGKYVNQTTHLPTLEVVWRRKKPWKAMMCLHHLQVRGQYVVGFTCTTFIGFKWHIRYIGRYENNDDGVLFSEQYNADKTRVWRGMINIVNRKWIPHEPFGQWVDAKDFVLTPMTWDLLNIKN